MIQLQAAFDLLGVSPDSDPDTVKKAWRSLVRSYHPDSSTADLGAANGRLAEINAAFDAVSACSEADRSRLLALMAARTAAERNHLRAEADERARLEALAAREMEQDKAARAVFSELPASPSRSGRHGAATTRRGADPAGADQPGREDARARRNLAHRAVASLQSIRTAFAKGRRADRRSVSC